MVQTLVVGTLFSQNKAAERRPVVVVPECEEDRCSPTAKLLQHLVDDLVAFGAAIFAEVAADNDERRSHVELSDPCQHAPHLAHGVDAREELSGPHKMEIAQLEKNHRHEPGLLYMRCQNGTTARRGDDERV